MATHKAAEALTLSMLEQAIAEREPWARDELGEAYCFYCGIDRYTVDPVTGKLMDEPHRADCLWQACRMAKYRAAIGNAPNWRDYAPKDGPSRVKNMHWHKPPDWELAQNGKGRASVWLNGTWHTWDKYGVGGENAREDSVEAAKAAAESAIVRQGWGKFEVER